MKELPRSAATLFSAVDEARLTIMRWHDRGRKPTQDELLRLAINLKTAQESALYSEEKD